MAARRGARPAARQPGPRGFSLIEMALVLIVLGVLTTLIMPPILASVRKEKNTQAKNALRSAKDSVIGYAMLNHVLPPTLAAAGVTRDPWSRDYRYWSDSYLTSGTATPDAICTANSTKVVNFLNMKVKGGGVNATAFVLASLGPDGATTLPVPPTKPTDLTNLGDDLVEYVTLAQLKTLVCSPSRTPQGSELGGRTSANTKIVGNMAKANKATVTVADNAVTVTHAADATGTSSHFGACQWITDTSGPSAGDCRNGVCTFNRTIEVFFKFKIVSGSKGGFTFVAARNNTVNEPCGAESGVYLAYAGISSNSTSDNVPYIPEPRAGVEYDITYDSAQDAALSSSTAPRHVIPIFWGQNYVTSTPSTATDDNLHGVGAITAGFNPSTVGMYIPFTGGNLTGYEYQTRIRLDRNPDGTMNTTVFVKNSNNTDFSDLSKDYPYGNSSDLKARYQTAWSGTGVGTYYANMNRVRLGWTLGANNTSLFSMQYYGMGFRFK